MSDPFQHESEPFLTIIAWPDGYDREQVVQLLAKAAGFDAPSLRLRLGQAPPMILVQVDSVAARMAVDALVTRGGDAFAPTLADLTALGPTLKIKEMRIEGGDLAIDLWRGPNTVLRRENIQILVRAHLAKTTTKRLPPATTSTGRHYAMGSPGAIGPGLAFGVGLGGLGMATAFEPGYLANASSVDRTTETSDKLDIHTADGLVFQVDGDKFAYGILGELRDHSDKTNMDAMCELLTHLAPEPIVDPYFSLWKPPPSLKRFRVPDMKVNQDDPAFAFYSRWAALMYRHLLSA